MTDKKKITLIYVGVAVICAGILGLGAFLASLKSKRPTPVAEDVGKEEVGEIVTLAKDIELVKQDGSAVKISDLEDKVWVAAQFYASCPMCAKRNATRLLDVYQQFRENPDFRVVCLSVDPEQDAKEHLLAMEKQLEVDGKSWWFVKTDKEKIWDYMRNVMFFTDIRERTVQEEIDTKGRWAHDMGLQIYRGNTMVGRCAGMKGVIRRFSYKKFKMPSTGSA